MAAQVTRRSFNSNAITVAPTTPFNYPIGQPAGIVNGDLVRIGLALNGSGGTITPPAGFVLVGSDTTQNPRMYEWEKVIKDVANEPATWNIVGTAGVTAGTWSAAYIGASQSSPSDVPAVVTAGAATTTPSLPGITPLTDNGMLVVAIGCNSSSATITETSALIAEVVEVGGKKVELDDGLLGPGGVATGAITFTLSASLAYTAIVSVIRAADSEPVARPRVLPIQLLSRFRAAVGGFGPLIPNAPLQGDVVAGAGEAHQGSAAITGGGVVSPVDAKGGLVSAAITGSGVVTPADTTNRLSAQRVTGGGVVSTSQTTARFRSNALTGGGVIAAGQTTARNLVAALTGGGVVTAVVRKGAIALLQLVGGGVVSFPSRVKGALVSVVTTAGGVVSAVQKTARSAIVAATGGGVVMLSGVGLGTGVATGLIKLVATPARMGRTVMSATSSSRMGRAIVRMRNQPPASKT